MRILMKYAVLYVYIYIYIYIYTYRPRIIRIVIINVYDVIKNQMIPNTYSITVPSKQHSVEEIEPENL